MAALAFSAINGRRQVAGLIGQIASALSNLSGG
jgi:hypothetical protein